MAKTTAAKAERVLVLREGGEQDADESPTKGLPLFQTHEKIASITVFRLEPVEEGNVGTMPPDSDDETIRRKWGGGTFKIVAKGTDGQFAGQRTLIIGGDPIFESKDALRRYRVKLGELPPEPKAAPVAAVPPSMGIAEVLAMINQGHSQQMEMMRLQLEANRREADERERRTRQEAEERELRARREAEESRERDRQFNATMLTLVKSDAKAAGNGPMEAIGILMQGLNLGRKLGAGAEDKEQPSDPVTMFLGALPGILEHGKNLVDSAKAGGGAQPNPKGAVLSGPVTDRLKVMVEGLMGRGYSKEQALHLAEQAIAQGVELLAQVPNAPQIASAPAESPAAAPPAAPPQPPAPPLRLVRERKKTPQRPRATHRM